MSLSSQRLPWENISQSQLHIWLITGMKKAKNADVENHQMHMQSGQPLETEWDEDQP